MQDIKSLFISRVLVFAFFFSCLLSDMTAATSVIKYTPTNLATKPQGEFFDSSNNLLQVSSMSNGSINISGTVATVGCYSFHNINSVTSITLPESVSNVGYFAFSNCKSLTQPIYNTKVFARMPVTTSGSYALPSGIIKISSAAFRECNKITSITLSANIQEIEESAFALCSSLSEVKLNESVSKIGSHAFWNCSKLSKIYVGSKPATVSSNTFDGVNKSTCILYVPSNSISTYKNTAIWKEFANIVAYSPDPQPEEPEPEVPVNGDFKLWFSPYQLGNTTPCYMRCETNVKEISFDILMPDWVLSASTYSLTPTTSDIVLTQTNYKTYLHVVVKSSSGVSFGKGEKTQFATFYMKNTGQWPEDVCSTIFDNVTFIASNNAKYEVADYEGNYYVGSPTASIFAGDYSEPNAFTLLSQTIARDQKANYGNIYLDGVCALPDNTEFDTSINPNLIIFSNNNLSIKNNKNVVVDNICSNLIINDKYPFKNWKTFTAKSAHYERSSNAEWGSLLLPFKITTNSDVVLYEISEFDDASGLITLTTCNYVEANTPCLYKCSGTCSFTSSNVQVPVSSSLGSKSAEGCVLYGTFSQKQFSTPVYYLANNSLWQNSGTLTINPYRCWFECSSSANAPGLRFDDATGISTIGNDGESEINFYDLHGNRVLTPVSGNIYILNGKKILFK